MYFYQRPDYCASYSICIFGLLTPYQTICLETFDIFHFPPFRPCPDLHHSPSLSVWWVFFTNGRRKAQHMLLYKSAGLSRIVLRCASKETQSLELLELLIKPEVSILGGDSTMISIYITWKWYVQAQYEVEWGYSFQNLKRDRMPRKRGQNRGQKTSLGAPKENVAVLWFLARRLGNGEEINLKYIWAVCLWNV